VQQLRAHSGFECCGTRLDQPQTEVDVAEQLSLVGLRKGRSGTKLRCPADVMEDRSRE
jgi:hypothetical protein